MIGWVNQSPLAFRYQINYAAAILGKDSQMGHIPVLYEIQM